MLGNRIGRVLTTIYVVGAAALLWLGYPEPVMGGEEPIRDNSFFIEEAYNQEAGVVQHIFTGLCLMDKEQGVKTRAFGFGWTDEWPLGGETHQLSWTVPYQDIKVDPRFGPTVEESGLGDMAINYRYQLFSDTERFPAVAPRVSLILPTGDEKKGLGNGELGYQFNLPISKDMGAAALHFNAGTTYVAGVDAGFGKDVDLRSYFIGCSAVHHTTPTFNLLLEYVTSFDEFANGLGGKSDATSSIVSPGVRYAINRGNGAQYVLGLAAPVGVSDDAPDWGVFTYLSVEYAYGR